MSDIDDLKEELRVLREQVTAFKLQLDNLQADFESEVEELWIEMVPPEFDADPLD